MSTINWNNMRVVTDQQLKQQMQELKKWEKMQKQAQQIQTLGAAASMFERAQKQQQKQAQQRHTLGAAASMFERAQKQQQEKQLYQRQKQMEKANMVNQYANYPQEYIEQTIRSIAQVGYENGAEAALQAIRQNNFTRQKFISILQKMSYEDLLDLGL